MDTVEIETDIFSDFGSTKNPENMKCVNDEELLSDLEVKKEYDFDNNETFVGQAKFESKQRIPFNGRDFIDKLLNYDRELILFKPTTHERNEEIVVHNQNDQLAIHVKQEIGFPEDTSDPILKEEIEFVDVQQNENTDDDSIYNEHILRINEGDFKSCSEDSEDLLVRKITQSKSFKKTKGIPRKIGSRFNKYILNFNNSISREQKESAAVNSTNANTVCSDLDAHRSPFFIFQQQTSSSKKEPCDRTDNIETDLYPFKCKLCDFRSYIEVVVQRHMIAFHPKQKTFIDVAQVKMHECIECGFNFQRKSALKRHIDIVHKKEKKFQCALCDYRAYSNNYIKDHWESVHSTVKSFKCEICDYGTNRRTHLNFHINAVHLKRKDFKCHLCDYACSRKVNLKRHVDAVHSKQKNYNCKFCDYQAYSKFSMKAHNDRIHSRGANFKCSECCYETCMKSSLVTHVNIVHLKLKNYKCHLCDHATTRKGRLQSHMEALHSNWKEGPSSYSSERNEMIAVAEDL